MAIEQTLIHHLGTAAFGSLIITICSYVLLTLRKMAQQRDNAAAACSYGLLQYVAKFLQRFNRNAYIMCAMHGKPFCSSALDAYRLIIRNVLRYIVTELVTGLLFGLCKCVIAVAAGLCVLYFVDGMAIGKPEAFEFMVLAAYFVADTFIGVYAVGVDTLVLCCREYSWLWSSFFLVFSRGLSSKLFVVLVDTITASRDESKYTLELPIVFVVEDSERNDGSDERPYYMSKRLMEILAKENDSDQESSKLIDGSKKVNYNDY